MSRKMKVKLVVIVVLTVLIGGSMLATGSGEAETAVRSAAGGL